MLLRSSYRIRSLLVTPARWAALEADVGDRDVEVFVGAAAVVNEVAGFPLHRGALASADRPSPLPAASVLGGPLVVVTEGINDHENLGSLFRNAAAFGASAVLLDPTSCDPLYRRSIRVSMGHVLHVPFATMPALPSGLSVLRSAGYEVLALTPAAEAVDVATLSPDPGRRRALLVGAEGPGLTPATLADADLRVRIPMAPGVDSVNIATAAAIALHRLAP
jgi:tRNA G18 (ribose-2'-O)-methylase SpoU